MTQDERWEQQYEQIRAFMNEHHRRPSKHHIEEHLMLNWFKYNKKMMAKGLLPDDRMEKFEKLLEEADGLRRKNQYA